jgi:DNA polymerase-3 subunit beta
MKFTIEKSIFTQTLKSSVGILDAIITNPIMDCVLLEVTNNELIITSSNNSASLKNTIKSGVKVEKEGKALVKGRIIYNIVSKLKEKELTLEIIDSSILRINTTTFSSDINVLEFFSYPNINFDYAD